MQILLLFLLIPLIEIALFIQVGGLIGLWPTLIIVVATAIAGAYLVRQQGLQVLSQVQSSFNQMQDPTEPLAHGAMILFSGALLLTPGFFTDAVGFALLVPAVRLAVFRFVRQRVHVTQFSTHGSAGPRTYKQADTTIIDADYRDLGDTAASGSQQDAQRDSRD